MTSRLCNAAVFHEAGTRLRIEQFPLPDAIEPGAALCRIRMSTICGSDLHTISGRRQEPTPLILGHEIMGEIVALGEGLDRDRFGDALKPGDRATWSIMACCGKCFYCQRGLPQKCEHLRKYGHSRCTEPPYLTGGYAEYICLLPGTAIYRIPDTLPDEVATPANCALSTVINAAETIGLSRGETVLIQGAGLLGLNLVALAAEAGAKKIIVTDVKQSRLELAARFGADVCLDVAESCDEEVVSNIADQTGGYGADVAFEVSGAASVVAQAMDALRIGGRYLIAGLVMPGADLGIEGNQVTRKYLTIKGIHNYHPDHLGKALTFLAKCHQKYPYRELVGKTYALTEINEAVDAAFSGQYVRLGIVPA